jgi:hypothetical protein
MLLRNSLVTRLSRFPGGPHFPARARQLATWPHRPADDRNGQRRCRLRANARRVREMLDRVEWPVSCARTPTQAQSKAPHRPTTRRCNPAHPLLESGGIAPRPRAAMLPPGILNLKPWVDPGPRCRKTGTAAGQAVLGQGRMAAGGVVMDRHNSRAGPSRRRVERQQKLIFQPL